MFQVVTMWNLSRPDEEIGDNIEDIQLRGYNAEAFLTGEFARKLSQKQIKPLSVGYIADRYCPTRRLLYLAKAINLSSRVKGKTTWGRVAGNIVESYIERILGQCVDESTEYSHLIDNGRRLSHDFVNSGKSINGQLKTLREVEKRGESSEIGDTDWLLKLLDYNGRAELGLSLLNSIIKEETNLDAKDILMDPEHRRIEPKEQQIGINSPTEPDFIIPDFGIVGDIKSGTSFKDHFLLTCAGYALAYENQHGKGRDINWGIIYFFPTRVLCDYVRPLTLAQVYIFSINDSLRDWFIRIRNEAYDMISKSEPPDFPSRNERVACRHCRFRDHCESEGLEL